MFEAAGVPPLLDVAGTDVLRTVLENRGVLFRATFEVWPMFEDSAVAVPVPAALLEPGAILKL